MYLEGTRHVRVSDCNFTRLDGNGLIVSGFNRNATVAQNTFSWIGDNAVVVWGRTNETARSLRFFLSVPFSRLALCRAHS